MSNIHSILFLTKILNIIFFRIQLEEPPLVKTAATVFQELCYNYRDQLMAGIICAGWDRRLGGQVETSYVHFYLFSNIFWWI